jgi:zinc protease
VARRLIARPRPAWLGDLPVFERTLGNGLRALVLPRPQAPVVVCDLYYPVGSANEPPGQTGLAHFVEHMLFKGTDRLPKGQIDRLAFLAAGQINAETGEDSTHYWFALPRDRWELALAVESDRMIHAAFDPIEVESERHVIAEERARELDSPLGRLDQTHLALSYLTHPYRNPILGWPEDLRGLSVFDLTAFYRDHYRPDGAVLVAVGDLEPESALDRIAAHFDHLAPGPSPRPSVVGEEGRQAGRRSFELIEAEAVARGLFGWHSVPFDHPDGPALDVLADVLTCGRRSRLWDRLVERERIATWVDAAQEGARLAGQFLISLEAAPGVDPKRLEASLLAELARMASSGPTEEELARSRRRLEAAWRWEQEDLAGLAAGLGHMALWGDWRAWQEAHRAALAVTPEDLQRVARTYLATSGLTSGWLLPKPGRGRSGAGAAAMSTGIGSLKRGGGARVAAPPALDGPMPLSVPPLTPTLPDYRPVRSTLRNGLRLIHEVRENTGIVALDLYIDSGLLRESKPGLAHLVGRLREEGTLRRDAEAIAAAVEDVGGTLDVTATGVSLRARAEDLAMAVDLAAEVTLEPAFPVAAMGWLTRRIAADLASDRDDPAFRADLAFRELVYGRHCVGRDPRGTARQLARLTRADVIDHHARFTRPDAAFLVAVGDFDPKRLRALVSRAFGGWTAPTGSPLPPWPLPKSPIRPRSRRIARPGEQVHVVIGHLGITRADPDLPALAVLDHILGSGPGFTDRLSRVLRDEMGLAYSVGGGITDSADLVPGLFRVYVGTGPEHAAQAIAVAREQVRAMHEGRFLDDEVTRAQQYLAGSWVFDYQTVGQRADRLLELERWGLPLDEPLRWPEQVARVTPEQVRLAARRHLHPDALCIVEYGPIG